MGMAGYTKLFNSILFSTIWREDDKTRIVWITLLAMSDKNGIAETSLPSLADAARVSLPDCEIAIEKLKSPDKYSRTKDNEGRRIRECDGGFVLLNHGKYRAKMSADERREYNRIKQKEWREENVKPASNNVIDKVGLSALSAHTEAKADSEADSVTKAFNEFWTVYPRKAAKKDAEKAFPKAIKKVRLETMLVAIRSQARGEGWTKDAGKFIPYPASWLNGERWNDSSKIEIQPPRVGGNF